MSSQAWRPTKGIAFLGAATLAVLLLMGANPSGAWANHCEKNWVGGSGNWNEKTNWADGDADPNNNVPGSGDTACIDNAGALTVTIVNTGPNPGDYSGGGNAESLVLGDGNAGNGTVSLNIVSSNPTGSSAQNGSLSLGSTSTINTDGVVTLTSTNTSPGQAELLGAGPINNSGTIRSAAGSGGGRLFGIPINNLAAGTIDIAASACQCFTATWTNNGTFNVADGATFTLTGTGGGPTFNQAAGTLDTNATGTFFQSGGFFNHNGGDTEGTKPVQLCGPALNASGTGTGAYDFVRVVASGCGGGQLSGNIAAGKTVRLNNDSNGAMGVTMTTNVANNGTLILDGPSEDQLLGGLTLTNNNLLRTTGTGGRLFGITLTNTATGSVDIDQGAAQGFTATWTNNGSFDVANGEQFTLTGTGGGPTFNQSGGTLTTNASGIFFQTGGAFNHTGGSQSGNPVQLCGPGLNAPSGDAGSYDFVRVPVSGCGGGTITGNIGSGKTVRLNNDSNGGMGVSLTTNVTNDGSLILTGPSHDELLGGFTLTNNGLFQVTGSGTRQTGFSMNNTATGTIDIDQDVGFNFTTTTTNNGTIDIADGETLSTSGSGGGPTFNQSGGTIDTHASGLLLSTGGTWNHTGGSHTGNPIQLCGPALNAPTGGAANYDFVRRPANFCGGGTITGNIGAGKVVRMNNTSNGAMGVSLTTSIANNGTLVMTGTEEDQLLGGNTLTNNGTFQVAGSGARLTGFNLTNSATGTFDVDQDVHLAFSSVTTNNGVIDIAAGETMVNSGSGGGPTYNQNGGTVNVAGTLNSNGAYNHTGGTTTVAAGGQVMTNGQNIAMSGGTLKGTGTVNVGAQSLNNTGGTVAPGGSAGILTITGNYAQGAGGTLATEISGTTAGSGHDRLVVSGNASLNGTLAITTPGFAVSPGQSFRVLTPGSRGGTFATVTGGAPFTVQYNGPNVDLVVSDADSDGVADTADNCQTVANPSQANADGDALGDACDTDNDNDGIADGADNCPAAANAAQTDTDADGQGDACDAEDDGDGVPDAGDNCPITANAAQTDTDVDGEGDACDADTDGDGAANGADNCPNTANADQSNNDGDSEGDACDANDDNDGLADAADACPTQAASTADGCPASTPPVDAACEEAKAKLAKAKAKLKKLRRQDASDAKIAKAKKKVRKAKQAVRAACG